MRTSSRLSVYWLKVQAARIIALGAGLGYWLYAVGPGGASPLVLPEPLDVWREFAGLVRDSAVYSAALYTFVEIAIAFSIASVVGVTVGFVGARSRLSASVLEPMLVWGYLVPHILFYPLIILWFGIGPESKIVYAASSAIFPIGYNCLKGFRTVEPKYMLVGRAFGASPRQIDMHIKLRAGLPVAAAGLRIGAALTMITIIVAEMLASTNGLGFLIRAYSQSFLTARMYAMIVVVLCVVAVYHVIVGKLLPNAPSERKTMTGPVK